MVDYEVWLFSDLFRDLVEPLDLLKVVKPPKIMTKIATVRPSEIVSLITLQQWTSVRTHNSSSRAGKALCKVVCSDQCLES